MSMAPPPPPPPCQHATDKNYAPIQQLQGSLLQIYRNGNHKVSMRFLRFDRLHIIKEAHSFSQFERRPRNHRDFLASLTGFHWPVSLAFSLTRQLERAIK